MKFCNIKFSAVATFPNGNYKSKFFATEKAMSKWANAQFSKDEGVVVEVWEGAYDKRYCTYQA